MNLVDLGIVLVIGLGILIGWRNGLIGPLLAEATFLLTFWIISTHPGLIALVPSGVPRPLAPFVLPIGLGLLVGIVGRVVLQSFFRLPLTRSLDKLLGAAVNGGLAFVIVYVVLLGLVSAGTVLDPLVKARTVQSSQVTAMQMLLAENPQAGNNRDRSPVPAQPARAIRASDRLLRADAPAAAREQSAGPGRLSVRRADSADWTDCSKGRALDGLARLSTQ